jgi:hypothetical protein
LPSIIKTYLLLLSAFFPYQGPCARPSSLLF